MRFLKDLNEKTHDNRSVLSLCQNLIPVRLLSDVPDLNNTINLPSDCIHSMPVLSTVLICRKRCKVVSLTPVNFKCQMDLLLPKFSAPLLAAICTTALNAHISYLHLCFNATWSNILMKDLLISQQCNMDSGGL